MKKKLTYASLLLITLIAGFGFKLNVHAACEGYSDYNTCRNGTMHGDIVVGGYGQGLYASGVTRINKSLEDYYYTSVGVTAYFNRTGNFIYSGYIQSNMAYRLYCLDAQYVGTNPLYASRFLLNTNSDITIQAMDVALLSILTGNGGTGTLVSSTRGADYWARLLAMRAIVATFGMHNSASGTYNSAYYAALTATNTFLSHSDTAAARNELVSALNALGKTITPVTSFSGHPNYYFSGTPVTTAEAYYVAALRDAAEYVRNYSEGGNVDTTTTLPVSTEIETTEDSVGTMVERDVTHTIIVSGLTNNGSDTFTIDGITMDHVPEGLDYYVKSIKIGDYLEYETTNAGQDIAQLFGVNLLGGGSEYDFTEPTEITLTVHFEGFVESDYYDTLSCGDSEIEYSINGSYSTEIQNKYSGYVATIWYSGTSQKQRYLGIEPAGDNQESSGLATWSSPYSTRLIEACDCDDLIEACLAEVNQTGSLSGTACQELFAADCGECAELEVECAAGNQDACREYGEVCEVECGTTVDTFNCCDANNNLIVSPLDDWEVNITGPENVRACFVDQIDGQAEANGDAGASTIAGATDEMGNSYTLEQNKYCAVSCKEDYLMTMPTAKLVNAGRYFTFKAAVEGTKTCYTNTIAREQYNEDMADIQSRIIDKYNEYLNWATALDNISENDRQYSGWQCCTALTGECFGCWAKGFYVDGYYDRITYDVDEDTGIVEIDRRPTATRIGVYDVYNDDGLFQRVYGPGDDGGSSSSSCDHDCSAVPGDEDTLRENITTLMDTALRELNQLVEDRNEIIAMYDDCTNWDTELNYNPEVYYDYEESYLADFYNNYGTMSSVVDGPNNSEWYCNIAGVQNRIDYPDLVGTSYDACDGSTSSSNRKTTFDYVICTEDGCDTQEFQVSDARYKKLTSEVDATYLPDTLFYNIYPTGEITDTPGDNTVAIENGLPVSLSTRRGIYKYTVNMTDLGEYYDQAQDDNLGRLIGGNDAVINQDDYGEFVDENGTVQYACSYLVNMGITDGDTIVCDFDTECTGDDCIADCIGPNCDYECDGDDCIADCIGAGCIYDSDAGTSLIERVVSLSNLFPDGTNSYNWNRDANDKAATTIDEIQDAGNAIYEEEPIFSVTITPSVARAIKQYNDDAEAHGGYSNSTLSCYALDGYEEIACYSSFITGLLEGRVEYDGVDYINNIDVVNDRSLIMGNNYRTVRDDNTEYFTTWSGGISEEDMIGPSWK